MKLTRHQVLALGVLLLAAGCSGSNRTSVADGSAGDGATCACVFESDVAPYGCVSFTFGCPDNLQQFTVCDVAPGCWHHISDPRTGCKRPGYRAGCGTDRDAGPADGGPTDGASTDGGPVLDGPEAGGDLQHDASDAALDSNLGPPLDGAVDMAIDHLPSLPNMVPVSNGQVTFTMGSPVGEMCRPASGEDQRIVTLTRAFLLHRTEVTVGQFKALMGYAPATTTCVASHVSDCPVANVTWHEAAAYCNALSAVDGAPGCYSCNGSGSTVTCVEAPAYMREKIFLCPGFRLPTEAEWEYAARGGVGTAFYSGPITSCWGLDPNADVIAWYAGNASGLAHRAVALKQANAYGLHDMLGNVAEWTHDIYGKLTSTLPATNPWGQYTGPERVRRGGSVMSSPGHLRAAHRESQFALAKSYETGFRCARSY